MSDANAQMSNYWLYQFYFLSNASFGWQLESSYMDTEKCIWNPAIATCCPCQYFSNFGYIVETMKIRPSIKLEIYEDELWHLDL